MISISSFICFTNPERRGDTYKECVQSALGFSDEVIIVDGFSTDGSLNWIRALDNPKIKIVLMPWPEEFDWKQISKSFQYGYDNCTSDFVVHLDADFIIHERDYAALRKTCEENSEAVAFSLLKRQFILPDRFNLKSRLVVAVNKGKYGDKIRFDSGGDAAQPSYDSKCIEPGTVPDIKLNLWNYEKIRKTEAQIKDDVGRMSRAWNSHFGEYRLGGPDNKSAYDEWLKMEVGRFGKPSEHIKLEEHPLVIQETIRNLKPEQFGWNGFGNLERNDYVS